MPLTLDKPYLGLRIALHDSKLVFTPREGFCDGIELDKPYVGLRAATHDGKLVYLISDQKLESDGTMINGKPYIGLLASTHDGDRVYLVDGKMCDEEGEPRIIDCGEPCNEITIPAAGLILSVTEVTDILFGVPGPTGDMPLTWQENIVTQRDLDQSEQPCIENNVVTETGYFSEEFQIEVEDCPNARCRYAYDICTCILRIVIITCNADCPGQEPVQKSILGTLTIDDCDPYLASINDSPDLVASVSV